MKLNIPEVVAEATAMFNQYEQALVSNDIAVLDALFWDHPLIVRYGATENLYGIEAIRAFRTGRPTGDLARALTQTIITTFGRDLATANTEFRRLNSDSMGRQTQTWCRMPEGWRIVSAHVSLLGS